MTSGIQSGLYINLMKQLLLTSETNSTKDFLSKTNDKLGERGKIFVDTGISPLHIKKNSFKSILTVLNQQWT